MDEEKEEITLLQAAQLGDTVTVARYLLQKVDVDVTDSKGRTALMIAVQHHHVEVVAQLLPRNHGELCLTTFF